MGVIRKPSIIAGISGKVGTVVITNVRNTQVIKEVPTPAKKGSQTEDQAKQRALFKFGKDFLLRIGYDVPGIGYQLRKKNRGSKPNAMLKHLMLDAVKGEYPDFSIEFSKVKMSCPIDEIDACWDGQCVAGEGMTIDVTWEQNPCPGKTTRSHDDAVIVFYDENTKRNIYQSMYSCGKVPRNALKWSYKGYPQLVGHHIHCWIFFVSANRKRVSQSEYLGMVTMKA
ncbi:hypothetical protein SAMN06265348_101548 [Pedobacter westerhofensis]|uniref:Uncharacterized protein n=1 Tax=Pedobacter westerhofensis TaxID=425512 RepID=A0A521AYM4_9SPHI|nr:DUF6266 family protein [Pedobacter westerhofensis]SMO39934.1 hypothetical protein SAMN06265348_101548 [Pedobacter westerhofensis]